MKIFRWNPDKNEILKNERGISFELVLLAIEQGDILSECDHPNQTRYPNQKILEIMIDDYVYLVPFVESHKEYFLKTIIPSRKASKKHGIQRK